MEWPSSDPASDEEAEVTTDRPSSAPAAISSDQEIIDEALDLIEDVKLTMEWPSSVPGSEEEADVSMERPSSDPAALASEGVVESGSASTAAPLTEGEASGGEQMVSDLPDSPAGAEAEVPTEPEGVNIDEGYSSDEDIAELEDTGLQETEADEKMSVQSGATAPLDNGNDSDPDDSAGDEAEPDDLGVEAGIPDGEDMSATAAPASSGTEEDDGYFSDEVISEPEPEVVPPDTSRIREIARQRKAALKAEMEKMSEPDGVQHSGPAASDKKIIDEAQDLTEEADIAMERPSTAPAAISEEIVEPAPDTTSEEVESGPDATFEEVESGPDATPEEVESGPDATPEEVESGPDATFEEVESGPDATSEEVESGPDATSEEVESGPDATFEEVESGPEATPEEVESAPASEEETEVTTEQPLTALASEEADVSMERPSTAPAALASGEVVESDPASTAAPVTEGEASDGEQMASDIPETDTEVQEKSEELSLDEGYSSGEDISAESEDTGLQETEADVKMSAQPAAEAIDSDTAPHSLAEEKPEVPAESPEATIDDGYSSDEDISAEPEDTGLQETEADVKMSAQPGTTAPLDNGNDSDPGDSADDKAEPGQDDPGVQAGIPNGEDMSAKAAPASSVMEEDEGYVSDEPISKPEPKVVQPDTSRIREIARQRKAALKAKMEQTSEPAGAQYSGPAASGTKIIDEALDLSNVESSGYAKPNKLKMNVPVGSKDYKEMVSDRKLLGVSSTYNEMSVAKAAYKKLQANGSNLKLSKDIVKTAEKYISSEVVGSKPLLGKPDKAQLKALEALGLDAKASERSVMLALIDQTSTSLDANKKTRHENKMKALDKIHKTLFGRS